jgi:hypothetical protein
VSVTVEPERFTFVDFDAGTIGEIASDIADQLGFAPSTTIVVEVDQTQPFGGKELRSLDPVHCFVESGALEHPQHVRKLSVEGTRESIGRLLLEARDRLDPAFGAPSIDEAIATPVRVAWDVYVIGRLVRLGGRDQQSRRRYQFRNQHGFDDRADAAFDRLWAEDALTFAQIESISDSARQSAA